MKRLMVNLTGTVTSSASRSFVIEVPDDANISTFDQQVLEGIADLAKIGWDFHSDALILTTDHSVEEMSDSDNSEHVVIPLEEKTFV